MDIFKLMQQTNNNEVVFFEEPSVNLRLITAVNDTTLGPAIASCRMQEYENVENAAQKALSMAYYNTYRAAILRKGFGGAGIALYGDPRAIKNEMYFRALGIVVNKLNGKIYLVRSSSITHKDMLDIKRESNFLLGVDERYIRTGNTPVQVLAKGMMIGLKAIARKKFNADTLEGLSFIVQGLGEVGSCLVKELLKINNINLTITDMVYDKIKLIQDQSPNIKVVKPNEVYKEKCDIFLSCAENNLIGAEEVSQLNCKVLTGSTNDILANPEIENNLKDKKIMFVPGFIINGGELIQLDNEFKGKDPEVIDIEIAEIYNSVTNLLELAETKQKSLTQVAIEEAQNYINAVASIKKLK